MEIGKKIQKLRKERGLTQEALAEKIGERIVMPRYFGSADACFNTGRQHG